MRVRALLVAAALATLAAGCNDNTTKPQTAPTTTPPTTVSPTPTASATTTSPTPSTDSTTPGDTTTTSAAGSFHNDSTPIYSDDFSSDKGGWPVDETDIHSYRLADHEYSMTVKKANYLIFPHLKTAGFDGTQHADAAISAEIQKTLYVGSHDMFGVTCRSYNGDMYVFRMSVGTEANAPAEWEIAKHSASGDDKVLDSGEEPTGGSAWTIAGICANDAAGAAHLGMAINNNIVGDTVDSDSPLTGGYPGLYLDSSDGNTTVNVLNYKVYGASYS